MKEIFSYGLDSFFGIKTTFSKSKSLQHVQKIRPSFFKDAGVLFMINAQFSRLRFWSRRSLFLILETFYFRGGALFSFSQLDPIKFLRRAFLKIEEHTNDQDFIFRRPLFYFYLGWVPLQKRSRLRSTQTFNFLLFRRPLPKKDQDQDHPFNQNQPLPLYQRSGNFSKIKTKISHNYSITK